MRGEVRTRVISTDDEARALTPEQEARVGYDGMRLVLEADGLGKITTYIVGQAHYDDVPVVIRHDLQMSRGVQSEVERLLYLSMEGVRGLVREKAIAAAKEHMLFGVEEGEVS
mgnify:CR=1 FL=1